MLMYILFYFFNFCLNFCIYCGFLMDNWIKCKILNEVEIEWEIVVIKWMGFDSVLLVIGEYEIKVGIEYFCWVLFIIK